jgi:hypothetical protein
MSSRAVRLTTSAGCVAFVCAIAGEARAEDIPDWAGIFVNPGAVWLLADGPVSASGVGFELSAGYTWMGRGNGAAPFFMPHAGAVFRVQQIAEENGPDIGYLVAGVEGGASLLGLELTYVRRGQSANDDPLVLTREERLGLSPYLSLGLFTIGPQWLFPVSGSGKEPELGLNIGLKVPVVQTVFAFMALGHIWDRVPAGRPLRDGEAIVCPEVAGAPSSGAKTIEAAVAIEHWVASAALERAAVDAFAELEHKLTLLDAPLDLVDWCRRARADEQRHTTMCLDVARHLGAEDVSFAPLDPPCRSPSDLVALAIESLIDGCLAEGVAAAVARELGAGCVEPPVRSALEEIARDEADHAELAWSVVDFALEGARDEVRSAARLTASRILAESIAVLEERSDAGLEAEGVPSPARVARARREVGLTLIERLDGLIAG